MVRLRRSFVSFRPLSVRKTNIFLRSSLEIYLEIIPFSSRLLRIFATRAVLAPIYLAMSLGTIKVPAFL